MISIDSVLSVGPGEKLGELLESQEKTFQAQEKSWEKSLSARRKQKMICINSDLSLEPGEKLGELLECQEKTFQAQEKSWEKSLSARRKH